MSSAASKVESSCETKRESASENNWLGEGSDQIHFTSLGWIYLDETEPDVFVKLLAVLGAVEGGDGDCRQTLQQKSNYRACTLLNKLIT